MSRYGTAGQVFRDSGAIDIVLTYIQKVLFYHVARYPSLNKHFINRRMEVGQALLSSLFSSLPFWAGVPNRLQVPEHARSDMTHSLRAEHPLALIAV